MKRGVIILSSMLTLAVCCCVEAASDSEVAARKAALEVAGAFGNDGFKVRDGHWCGTVKPNDHTLIAVNLFDETGKQVTADNYDAGATAAAGFSPTSSGQYYIAIGLVEGQESSFCLIYSYK